MLPKCRLGKRSTMGALVCGPCHPTDGHQVALQQQQGESDGGAIAAGCLGVPPRPHGVIRVKLHPGQKVYVYSGGQECCGVVEQHNHVDNQVSIFLPHLSQHIVRKQEDVWTFPNPPLATAHHATRSVSSCIDVPKTSYRSPESVEMDEMMAAMVLTSLSCSPLLQSPSHVDTAVGMMECGGGELSDSGSSGYWSSDHGNTSPAPSPTNDESERAVAPPVDEGLDMELEQVLFDEPAPRKRKNSVKVGYRCLWPSCGKVLTSVVGIKRHIRTLHLGQSMEQERSQREEDFYYTEIYQDLDQATPALSTTPSTSSSIPTSSSISTSSSSSSSSQPSCASPAIPIQQSSSSISTSSANSGVDASPLSRSAPSESFWQVHCEHSYQAPAPPAPQATLSASPACRWTPSLTVTPNKQAASFRNRSVSVGEQWLQNHSASSRSFPASASPPRGHCNTRKVRGEAKKCRKVYGIEHRDQWCTACRWKKACQRFVD
ncbi:zinc finger protein 395a [Engraulis encrasicolus]|uniref:zinc finger protein 395a n=1 Tax=Engraulis encrasicolus TaxID=184585 RepID=UPI002FD30F46